MSITIAGNSNLMKNAGAGGARPRIAIIGSGVSGLSAAWGLREDCDIEVFERSNRVGGHVNTVVVDAPEGPLAVDTGFIVYNEPNYPNLTALFRWLGVDSHPTEMHFSVSARDRDIEYASSGLSGLFADLRNITRPRFFTMIADILRFYAAAPKLAAGDDEMTIGEFLRLKRYSPSFIDDHILPMAAAIWSCPVGAILEFPAKSLARFFVNHGLLEIGTPFEWRSVMGGSASYIEPLTRDFADRIRLNSDVRAVHRNAGGVELVFADSQRRQYDQAVFACHAPEALRLLVDADAAETAVLSAFRTQSNLAVLHGDENFMPRRRRAWASWNYLSDQSGENNLAVTYWMNELQHLKTQKNYFVTLNPFRHPAEESVIAEFMYEHPVFDTAALRAQAEIWSLQGRRNVWFAGAWLGYGFHEDGLQAGLAAAEGLSAWRRPWPFDFSIERLARRHPLDARCGLAA